MRRWREYYPQEDSPDLFTDTGWMGVDCRVAPEKLPQGMLTQALNVVLEDARAVTRGGVALAGWSLHPSLPFPLAAADGMGASAYVPGMTYRRGARVLVDPVIWECNVDEDTPVDENDLEQGGNWMEISEEAALLWEGAPPHDNDGVMPAHHACLHYWGDDEDAAPWLAVARSGMVALVRPGSQPVEVRPADRCPAPDGSRVLGTRRQLFWLRGHDLDPLVWDATCGSYAQTIEEREPSEDEDPTSPLPGGQVALAHRGRVLVGRGEELYISDLLSWRYSRVDGVEAMPGGAGRITALLPFGPDVLVFRERGIFRLSGLEAADWTITPVTEAKGAVGPDAVVVAGREVWFWADDGVYSLTQVGDLGENRLGVGDRPITLPVEPLWRRMLRPGLKAQVKAAVAGSRVVWALPVGTTSAGTVGHRCLVWRQDLRSWEGQWRAGQAPAGRDVWLGEAETDDWELCWLGGFPVLGEERLVGVGGCGAYEWLDGPYDTVGPWGTLGRVAPTSAVLSRGYGWDAEGPRRGDRLRVEVATWGASLTMTAIGPNGERKADPAAPRQGRLRRSRRVGVPNRLADNTDDRHGEDGFEDYALTLAEGAVLDTATPVDAARLEPYVLHTGAVRDARFSQVEVRCDGGIMALGALGLEARMERRDNLPR